MSATGPSAEALCAELRFEAQGERAGNVTTGRGQLDGSAVRVALVESRAASGAIGSAEAERLGAVFRIAAREGSPLVLYLDSAGAKVSEGLKALGAFRALYRAGLDALLHGTPIAAVLGRNCYGGSSMLAHLASRRLFAPGTQMAMSGPAILAAAAGVSAIDEMFRAMAQAALAGDARAKVNGANAVWTPGLDLRRWLLQALAAAEPAAALLARHEALVPRLEGAARPQPKWQPIRRRDLEKIYAEGYEARESEGLLEGVGRRAGQSETFLGIVGPQPLGSARAWLFADAAWGLAAKPPARLEVFLDCATHAARLDDERRILTEYIVDMAFALAAAAARGARVGLTVLGKAGGGVYVALAAPAARVASLYEADIQVLPGAAVAAILGTASAGAPTFDEYRAAGVAEEQLKLGLVPE